MNLIVCGLVRNASRNLEKNLQKIDFLRRHFESLKVIIFENDSTDNTKEILTSYRDLHPNHSYITIADYNEHPFKFGPFSKHRVDLMSKYRNMYLDKLKDFPETDYVILIDLDIFDFNTERILSYFKSELEFDMISAFGINYVDYIFGKSFYDIYAYTETNDLKLCFKDFVDFENKQEGLYKKFRKQTDLVKITSNFNGLAIYRYQALLCGARYDSYPSTVEGIESICEHIVLNNQLINKGFDKLYIDPLLVVTYENKKLSSHLKKYTKNRVIVFLKFIRSFFKK